MEHQEFSISDLVPEKWISDSDLKSISIVGYRIISNAKEPFSTKSVDFCFARAVFLFGQLKYLDTIQKVEWSNSGTPYINIEPNNKETNQGQWLLLLSPNWKTINDTVNLEIQNNITIAKGFIASFLGRNIVYEKVFENTIGLPSGNISVFSKVFLNPFVFPNPDISDLNINKLQNVANIFDALDPFTKNRITLALNWYNDSLTRDGVNAFICSWIAIETLAMPNTTNIRPINEILARIYDITLSNASEKFSVGKIFGLRSQIVHNGEAISIHYLLIEYLNALFVDILIDMLHLPKEEFAGSILEHTDFDLKTMLKI